MEVATIFESSPTKKGDGLNYPDLYEVLDTFLKDFCKINSIDFKNDNGKSHIIFRGVPVRYKLYRSHNHGRYFVSFLPLNRWAYPKQPNKNSELIPAVKATIDFFNLLPSEIDLGLKFNKSSLTGKIDISDWTFGTNPDIGESKISSIERFVSLGNKLLSKNLQSIDRIPIFFISGSSQELEKFELIKKEISPLFSQKPVVLNDMDNVREHLADKYENQRIFVFFFGQDEKINEVYRKYKKYFIDKEIPSQFISSTMALGQNILPFGKANLLIEILKKDNKAPIFLDNQSNGEIDGSLYLSDINETEKDKFFGVSISLRGDGMTEELVEIYKDIEYSSKYKDQNGALKESISIFFQEKDLTKLSSKIIKLSSHLRGKNIFIFVSKLWKYGDVELICNLLEKENIHVKKFVYVVEKANRFLFSSILEEQKNMYTHPYIIWDSQSASILTNTKMQFYGSIFPIYIESLRLNSDNLEVSDLEMILWLVKKRIYRIANFFSLRTPELLSLLDQFKQLPIGEVEALRIRLGFLL